MRLAHKQKNHFMYEMILFLTILIIIKPAFITEIQSLALVNQIINYIQIMLLFILIFLIIGNKKFQLNNITFYIILYQIILAIPTFMYNGSYWDYFSTFVQIADVSLLVSLVYTKKREYVFLNAMFWAMALILLANLFVMLIWPDGWYSGGRWLFGMENNMLSTILPGITFCLLFSLKYKTKYIQAIIVSLAGVSEIFLGGSATSMISIVLFATIIIISLLWKKNIQNEKVWFFASIVVSYGIIKFFIQHYFSYLIVTLLGKDMSLSFRDIVWENALQYIPQKLIFGYGVENSAYTISKITGMHMHNMYLDILYKCGIIGALVFYLMLKKSAFINKKNKFIVKKSYDFLFRATFAAFFVAFIAEVYTRMPLFYCLIAIVAFERK